VLHPAAVAHAGRSRVLALVDRSPFSAFTGALYVAGANTSGARTALVSARSCRAAELRAGCNDVLPHDVCRPTALVVASACVRVRAPLERATLLRSQDDGVTFPVAAVVDAVADQSAALAMTATRAGIVAVAYEAAVADGNASALTVALRVAFFRPRAATLERLGQVEVARYDARCLPRRDGAYYGVSDGAFTLTTSGPYDDTSFLLAYPRVLAAPDLALAAPEPGAQTADLQAATTIEMVRIRAMP
jgi:hypothetical protein